MTTTVSAINHVSENAFPAQPPRNQYAPLKVAEDTYLIRTLLGEGSPMAVYMNSMVILGKEPVIVDTGPASNRKQWMEDVFSLVDPKDVRWIFLSHDDHDHTGNLSQALELCTNATFITTMFQVERLSTDFAFPMNRMRWVNDGEAIEAGDRLLVAIRPPVFDSPTTRGLYDTRSRVYWAVDSFATGVTEATENVATLDPEFWAQCMYTFGSWVSPWHGLVDTAKWNRAVDRVAELDLSAILNAHSPVISGQQIKEAIRLMRDLGSSEVAPFPTQADLEAALAAAGI